ncbi:acetylornithine transaminase [Lentzea jiangxiensis]|uniref:Acetylornithine aminotransferase n=1 Tax=Lentzea jiangxiensis TaxID=641025 RepID=A0A1H0H911_9PSEU|nr:acetylornithine transaminase [Lentzea jiangxiensis]SDO15627.1 acetylornithine aminotransferase [Lentzea jiangxiensis]
MTTRWQQSMMDNYGTPSLQLERGEGAHVWDAEGNRYVDLLTGLAVNALGHAHPAIVEAVSTQIAKLGHTGNLYVNEPALELAERLLDIAGEPGKVFFCNSGAEANEAALKMARLTGRTKVVSTIGGFHGRTMGALTLTGQEPKRAPFAPLVPGVSHIPFGDVAALEAAIDDETAAFIVEPIQGEQGVVVPPAGYLQEARRITAEHGALFVLDEVQTGIGRLGTWFAFQQAGIVPDVVTLAKGIGGGLPLGATIGFGAAAELFKPGHHGTTYGGNPVCCAAGLAVLDTIASEGLLEHASSVGKEIAAGVEALHHPAISGVRGAGLLLGITLREAVSAKAAAAAQKAGYLINPIQPDVLRLAPPLVLETSDAQAFVAALPTFFEETP